MQKALLKQERKNKMVLLQKSPIQCKERSRKLEQQTARAVDVFNYLINFASVFYGWVSIVSLGRFELLEAVTKRSRKKSLCSVKSETACVFIVCSDYAEASDRKYPRRKHQVRHC